MVGAWASPAAAGPVRWVSHECTSAAAGSATPAATRASSTASNPAATSCWRGLAPNDTSSTRSSSRTAATSRPASSSAASESAAPSSTATSTIERPAARWASMRSRVSGRREVTRVSVTRSARSAASWSPAPSYASAAAITDSRSARVPCRAGPSPAAVRPATRWPGTPRRRPRTVRTPPRSRSSLVLRVHAVAGEQVALPAEVRQRAERADDHQRDRVVEALEPAVPAQADPVAERETEQARRGLVHRRLRRPGELPSVLSGHRPESSSLRGASPSPAERYPTAESPWLRRSRIGEVSTTVISGSSGPRTSRSWSAAVSRTSTRSSLLTVTTNASMSKSSGWLGCSSRAKAWSSVGPRSSAHTPSRVAATVTSATTAATSRYCPRARRSDQAQHVGAVTPRRARRRW